MNSQFVLLNPIPQISSFVDIYAVWFLSLINEVVSKVLVIGNKSLLLIFKSKENISMKDNTMKYDAI